MLGRGPRRGGPRAPVAGLWSCALTSARPIPAFLAQTTRGAAAALEMRPGGAGGRRAGAALLVRHRESHPGRGLAGIRGGGAGGCAGIRRAGAASAGGDRGTERDRPGAVTGAPGHCWRRAGPLLPADLDGGRRLDVWARHAGDCGGGCGGRLQKVAGVWQARRGMNEPRPRHKGGGRRWSDGPVEAGPARRGRIERGLPAPTPPPRRPHPEPRLPGRQGCRELARAYDSGGVRAQAGAASRRFGGGWAAPLGRRPASRGSRVRPGGSPEGSVQGGPSGGAGRTWALALPRGGKYLCWAFPAARAGDSLLRPVPGRPDEVRAEGAARVPGSRARFPPPPPIHPGSNRPHRGSRYDRP